MYWVFLYWSVSVSDYIVNPNEKVLSVRIS